MKTRGVVRDSVERAPQLDTAGQAQHPDTWVPLGLMGSIAEKGFVMPYCTALPEGQEGSESARPGEEGGALSETMAPTFKGLVGFRSGGDNRLGDCGAYDPEFLRTTEVQPPGPFPVAVPPHL